MGHGNYSHAAHAALVADRASLPANEVFSQRECHALMNPKGLKVREARDSLDHPNSLAIAFALDVTGSMGGIPRALATKELPTFMQLLNVCGIPDPQLLFMAIGDATSDRAPLQIGQFESTAELMDQWLTWSFLEGGGGGTGSESYELAFYTLAQHTDLDCWNKRKKKGYLFMTGDELPYPLISRHQIESLIGDKLDEDLPIAEVIAAASETWHLFFLIPDLQRRKNCEKEWRKLLGDHVICMEAPEDACAVAAAIVAMTEGALADTAALAKALDGNGSSRERTGAVIRAIRPYADLIDPASLQTVHRGSNGPKLGAKVATLTPLATVDDNGNPPAKAGWWQKLFG